MEEMPISTIPPTAEADSVPHPVEAPPAQYHSPSLTRVPLIPTSVEDGGDQIETTSKTPKSLTPRIRTPRFITPIGSPIRRALKLTRLDPQDAWLPITESRNGNAYYAAFHTLCSGIGIQALVLPVAFTILGCFTPCTYSYNFMNLPKLGYVIADIFNFPMQLLVANYQGC
ncbi:hypothetical protein CsatB_005524 [Cannabis sativa]